VFTHRIDDLREFEGASILALAIHPPLTCAQSATGHGQPSEEEKALLEAKPFGGFGL